ncbi:hypothetical protein BT93_B1188 [Corymbia citriodora subsp. variegata]|nr:hypothetical protein BT93_B1188 [Corymbia citriodora subsp. variegata]KAF8038573.1 hypothetical protein BT93_B1188 [Corymbia citriodora subsp. variegata]KAF8038574.1 hypothetical protein BT93_B1188 [Corymbia citriodora subsp. variegata]
MTCPALLVVIVVSSTSTIVSSATSTFSLIAFTYHDFSSMNESFQCTNVANTIDVISNKKADMKAKEEKQESLERQFAAIPLESWGGNK